MKAFTAFILLLCTLIGFSHPVSAQDIPTNKFKGDYYNGRNFETFVFAREDAKVSFDWTRGSPGAGISRDNFSIRWQGSIEFAEGDWEFWVKSDDGVRIYVDGQLIIDSWKRQSGAVFKVVKNMSAGSHPIKVEYFEANLWAAINFSWKKITPTTTSSGTVTKPGTTAVVPTTSPLYSSLFVSSCEDLTVYPETGGAPLEIEVSGAGYDPYGAIQSYIFNFGDGSENLVQVDSYASHIYDKPGSYIAALTVKDHLGNLRTADICNKTITVGGYYKEGIGGYPEGVVINSTISALPKTGIFDSGLGLIFITIPLAGFGLLLNRKFSKL